MLFYELTVWSVGFVAVLMLGGFVRRPVEEVGGFIVYRRSGHSDLTPRSSEFRRVLRWRSLKPVFDGVVVLSSRGAGNLERAAETARNAGAPLVVLVSGRTDVAEAGGLLEGVEHLVLDRWDHLPQAVLRTFRNPCALDRGDVSAKRNAGLVVARMLGWRTVLFVDDDVQRITATELRRAASLLAGADRGGAPRRFVGWTFQECPDFSVVGHAHAQGDRAPVIFAGGGAMAMACGPDVPFFPPVYNEDVLVELKIMQDDPDAVRVVGDLRQDAYEPYSDPEKAASQEFGEFLLEAWRRNPSPDELGERGFWLSVLSDRKALLAVAEQKLLRLDVREGVRAVRAARAAHRLDWPDSAMAFVEDWGHDEGTWAEFMRSLPAVGGLDRLRPVRR
ncbi:hypothetical protein [Lentzea sp. NPDC003310]|uniref:hypothetical protein n=1 Tax=Lentzea sp. NPDC003310 TaxID=3154447 RepID=UPI0033B062EC